jgi:fascin 1/2
LSSIFLSFFPRQPSPVRPVFNIVLLASTQFGNVTCDAEEKDNGARFEIIVPESAAGKWAFRHPERGYFLGASADKLVCSAKTPTENELW